MKKLQLFFVFLLLSVIGFGQLTVTIPTITATPGQTVNVPVKLYGASSSGIPISSANLKIPFDTTKLQFVTLVNFYSGTPVGEWYFSGNFDSECNSYCVAANWLQSSLGVVAVPDGTTLYEIQFIYKGGNSPLSFCVHEFTNAAFDLITNTTTSGAINLLTASLTGPTSVCLNSTGNIYTTNASQTNYVWTVSGGSITSGGSSGSSSATVTWNTAGTRNIAVSYAGAATSTLTVTVNPIVASVAVTASANPVISGTAVTFTATPGNGGTSPAYQWKVNGANAGTSSPAFTYTPANGDVVFCVLTSNAPCVTGMFTSNLITMTVTTPVVPPLMVTVSTKTAIPGQKVLFPVKIKGASASGAPISSANIQITYNPAVLQYDTLINFYSAAPSAQWFFSGNNNTIAANWIEPNLLTLAIPDSTTLFEIRFTYIGGTSTLPFTVNEFTDAQYNFITTNHVNGAINPLTPQAGYLACDFHQHSTYTDGSYSFNYVMQKDNSYGLSWWANSEHGGGFTTNGSLSGLDLGTTVYYDATVPNPIIGTVSMSGGHQNMWRWQSLRDYSFQNLQTARATYSNKMVFQSYEMNVPGHEHASLGLINNQFNPSPNCNPLAEFEFKFDASDADVTGGVAQGWTKSALSNVHAKAIESVAWLHNNYPSTSYLIAAHPERKSLNNIQGFRDMNNAGPDVCFGFESMPGHQKATDRGEYKTSYNTFGTSTYGGCGIYAAQVGGVWDAMLSEGRHWWLFASSDFHATDGDFFPGEYQKTYVYVNDRTNPSNYIDALRSGNSFVVEGDLIDSLDFKVGNTAAMPLYATIGQTFNATNNSVAVKIKIHDPQGNNYNTYSSYTNPSVNHIDLIKGKVTGLIAPGNPNYSVGTVSSTTIVARFDATGGVTSPNGITSQAWTDLGNGWKEVTYTYNGLLDSVYYRLRGTNHGLNVNNETDVNGNPLTDALMAPNNATKAFADLWFYSNPIFVNGPPAPGLTGPTNVCQGSGVHVYTTDAGKTNYNWTVSGGTIILGGTSIDNTVTIAWYTPGLHSVSVSINGSVTTTLPVTVNPTVTASVSITASANPVCTGISVTYTATPVNGGSTPAYQWKKNGTNVGTNGPTYTYTPANNDMVACVMTSTATCVTGSPATSNSITMTLNPLVATISITASANNVNLGTPVTFTAIPVNGGASPVYQWKVNGVNAGTSSPTFNYTPVNGDAVFCILTSNAPCVNGMYTSNLITMTVNNPSGALYVTLPSKAAMPGDVLYYPVKLKGASNTGTPISSANIQISYDPSVLHYDTLVNFYQNMPVAQWFFSGNNNTVAANWIEPNLLTLPVPDSTTLFEIKFTYLGGTSSLPYIVNEFTNASYDFIPTSHINGAVTSLVPINNTVQNETVANGQSKCYNALQVITVAGGGTLFTVQSGGSATFIAGLKISFMPGTTVIPGGYLHGYITTNGQYCNQLPNPTVSTPVSNEITAVQELTGDRNIHVYPNPTSGNFMLEVFGSENVLMSKAEIYNMSGLKVHTEILNNERKHNFELPELMPGMYFIHVFTSKQSEILKIVKY